MANICVDSMSDSNQVQETLMRWAAACSHSIGDAFDSAIAALQDGPSPVHAYEQVLRELFISCHLSSESVLILVSNLKLWDAETLLRSVVEGTFKFVYLCLGTKSEIEAKFREFSIDLFEIDRIKRHKRISDFLAAIPDPQSDEWKPFRDLLLPPEELQRLHSTYPRSSRKDIENRWSFHSIVNSFAGAPINLESFKHLFLQYGTGSHILHQDAVGIAVLCERTRRSDERREAIEMVHGAREISDLSVMAFLRYLAVLHLCGKDTQIAMQEYLEQEKLHNEKTHSRAYWHDIEYRH
jgi:hypothetical protein